MHATQKYPFKKLSQELGAKSKETAWEIARRTEIKWDCKNYETSRYLKENPRIHYKQEKKPCEAETSTKRRERGRIRSFTERDAEIQ